MSFQEAETIELLLEDLLFEDGFRPGLRPRDHRAVCRDGVGTNPVDALPLTVAGDLDERHAERLLTDLMSRREPPPAEETEAADEGSPEGLPAAERPYPPAPTPAARHSVRRLEDARRGVESFEPRNVYQAELRTVLLVIVDHMRREHCTPGEEADFERWWAVLEVYRRVLAEPEMAAASARTVLPKLLKLGHHQLTEQRLAHALGRRKPRVSRKKKRRRRWKKKRLTRKQRWQGAR